MNYSGGFPNSDNCNGLYQKNPRKFLKILKDADINTNNVYELKVFARLVQQKLI